MKYIVIELKTEIDESVISTIYQYDNIAEAKQKFYLILADATVSEYLCHAALIVQNTGMIIDAGFFDHRPETDNNDNYILIENE